LGFGVGVWGLGVWGRAPNPHPPIPNPQSPIPNIIENKKIYFNNNLKRIKLLILFN
jgi:hypothetical protein